LEDEDDAAEKAYRGRIRVFPGKLAYLIYKLPFVGLCKLHAQLNHGLRYFAQNKERNSGRIYKGRKREIRNPSRKKVMQEKILESIKGCKHPLIASGATTMGVARRAPNKLTL
jgi:hypothetical protein